MDQVFKVEIDNDRYAHIRFGDGINGKKPLAGTKFSAVYRTGNGAQGNIGRDTLHHIISDTLPVGAVLSLDNPLPATGGTDPESLEHAKAMAQGYDKTQARCVTLNDFKIRAKSYNDVQQASVRRTWTGSWFTYFVSIQRKSANAVNPVFANAVRQYIQEYALCGVEVVVEPPRWVPLRIVLMVSIEKNYQWASVKMQLQKKFDKQKTATHQGYFANGRFSFGQAIYLSHLIQAGLKVSGVASLEASVFQRFSRDAGTQIDSNDPTQSSMMDLDTIEDKITTNAEEIILVENDPQQPSKGIITFERAAS